MRGRPLLLLCLLLAAGIFFADLTGIVPVRGNPRRGQVTQALGSLPSSAQLAGEVKAVKITDTAGQLILYNSYLMSPSGKIPIYNVIVYIDAGQARNLEIPLGTLLLVSGELSEIEGRTNPGEFDKKQYYSCRKIYYQLRKTAVLKARQEEGSLREALQWFRTRLHGSLLLTAKDDAAFFQALLLGEREELSQDAKLLFQLAGILHILSISGLHIQFLGMGLYRLLRKACLSMVPAGLLSILFILLYGILTGSSVSAMRGLCMFFVSIFARILGRVYDPLSSLSLTAILILADSPAYLFDPSFLLSFGAVCGAALESARTERQRRKELWGKEKGQKKGRRRERQDILEKSMGSLKMGLSVFLLVLPVTLSAYGEVSLSGLLLNLLVLPLTGILFGSAMGSACLGLLCPGAGILAAFPGRAVLSFYEFLAEGAARFPYGIWMPGCPDGVRILGYYAALLLGTGSFLWCREGKKAGEGKRAGGVKRRERVEKGKRKEEWKGSGKRCPQLMAGCCTVLAVLILSWRPSHELLITALDVGQGDSIVIQTGQGEALLIDCGSSSKKLTGQYQLLPFLKNQGIRYLDAVFVSHTDDDHINGIRELLTLIRDHRTAIRVARLYLPELSSPPEKWRELYALAEEAGARVYTAGEGDRFSLGEIALRVLSPGESGGAQETLDMNENCLVLELAYRDFIALFPGDIGEETELRILPEIRDITCLKTAHHGSRYSTCGKFLDKARPEVAVISCAEKNTYGHPSPETIERLEEAGAHVEYTMKSGAVTLETDGNRWKVYRFLGAGEGGK